MAQKLAYAIQGQLIQYERDCDELRADLKAIQDAFAERPRESVIVELFMCDIDGLVELDAPIIHSQGEAPEAALAVQVLTGVTPEGVRFSASERPVQQPVPPIESFLETMKRRADAVASEVRHEQKGDLEILSFALSEPKQEHFFRIMRNKTAGYVLVVQFPVELRSKAIGMKDDFFGSFKIIPH